VIGINQDEPRLVLMLVAGANLLERVTTGFAAFLKEADMAVDFVPHETQYTCVHLRQRVFWAVRNRIGTRSVKRPTRPKARIELRFAEALFTLVGVDLDVAIRL